MYAPKETTIYNFDDGFVYNVYQDTDTIFKTPIADHIYEGNMKHEHNEIEKAPYTENILGIECTAYSTKIPVPENEFGITESTRTTYSSEKLIANPKLYAKYNMDNEVELMIVVAIGSSHITTIATNITPQKVPDTVYEIDVTNKVVVEGYRD